jgi:hypothetical protein
LHGEDRPEGATSGVDGELDHAASRYSGSSPRRAAV